jgi:hypothetical protein
MVIVVILMTLAAPLCAAPAYLGGYSGTILVPDTETTPSGQWDLAFHDSFGLLSHDTDFKATSLQYGVFPKLEVGVSIVQNGTTDAAFNGKYRLIDETSTLPSVAVGVYDIGDQVDSLNNSASLYMMLSKNITPFASRLSDMPSKPLRLSIGAGTGIFNGFLASLDWTLLPRFSVQAEYFGGHIGDHDHFADAGVRYAVTNALRLDAGTIDFQRLAIGVNLRSTFK